MTRTAQPPITRPRKLIFVKPLVRRACTGGCPRHVRARTCPQQPASTNSRTRRTSRHPQGSRRCCARGRRLTSGGSRSRYVPEGLGVAASTTPSLGGTWLASFSRRRSQRDQHSSAWRRARRPPLIFTAGRRRRRASGRSLSHVSRGRTLDVRSCARGSGELAARPAGPHCGPHVASTWVLELASPRL